MLSPAGKSARFPIAKESKLVGGRGGKFAFCYVVLVSQEVHSKQRSVTTLNQNLSCGLSCAIILMSKMIERFNMCKDGTKGTSIVEERMEALSASRRDSLEDFASSTGAEFAAIFLHEELNDQNFLISAYSIGRDSLKEKLRDKRFSMDEIDTKQPFQSSFARFMDELRSFLALEEHARLQPLFQKPVTGKRQVEFIGVVVYVAVEKNSKLARAAATILSGQFSLSRSQRVVETTIGVQKILQSVDNEVENPLKQVAEEIATAVFCRDIYLKYVDSDQFVNVRTGQGRVFSIVEPDMHMQDDAVRCSLKCNDTDAAVPAIYVPVDKPHYRIHDTPFGKISKFTSGLERELYSMEAIVFVDKVGNHYLQNAFSLTDIGICNRIFFNMQGYLASNEFQDRLLDVIQELVRVDTLDKYPASEVQRFILGLDKTISSVVAVSINRNDDSFSLEIENGDHIDDGYLEKVSSSYLSKIFAENGGEVAEGVFVGADSIAGRKVIEVHLSSHMKDGKLFLLQLKDEWISDATLRAVLHYFSELHVRLRREKFLEEREAFMSQVRQVIVHHISPAQRSLIPVQRAWSAAKRDKSLWVDLRKNEHFRGFVDKAVINLAMASRKLELGRFLIHEIEASKLNRKQLDLVGLVQEILETFNFDRDDKRLVFKAVLKGSQPNILNADREFLSIALVNLIDNAIKYSSVDKQVEWGIDFKDDRYRFHITSRGVPIQTDGDKEDMIRTRLRAKQLDHLNQRHGTGWGLPVAAKILEAHHRDAKLDFVSVEDSVERSNSQNTFFFEMPYRTGQSQNESQGVKI